MSRLSLLFILSLFTSLSYAGTGTCVYNANGTSIVVRGMGLTMSNLASGNGSVEVDGREVARFEMRNASISMVYKTIRVTNNQGDILDAKVTSVANRTAVIRHFKSPGYGIDLRNYPVKCY